MYAPDVITAPLKEPVTHALAKLQCRAGASVSEDELIDLYISAARRYFEGRTGSTIHQTSYRYVLDAFPGDGRIVLPRATPLISIDACKYYDSDGTEHTLAASEYIADRWEQPGALVLAYNKSWPSFRAYPVAPVRIDYTAGIAASPDQECNETTKIAILMLVAGMWENRESVIVSDTSSVAQLAVQYGVEAFIVANIKSYVF